MSHQSYPNIWYQMDITRIVCPHAMKSLPLFLVRQYCVGDVAASLLHYQREAHRVGAETIPEGTLLLGTPAHCIVGVAPPWRKHQGADLLPEAFERVAERHMAGKYRLALRVFAGECVQTFKSRRMPHEDPETVFHRVNPIKYDVFVVYAAFVKCWRVNQENHQMYRAIAEQHIIQEVMDGGVERARALAELLCDTIEDNEL